MTSHTPVRIDRLLTVGVAGPLLRLVRRPAERNVPVLMYHSISQPLEAGRSSYHQTVTRPISFARQILQMASQGYQFITLSEAVSALQAGQAGVDDSRRVVITFDDGYRDFLDNAFPVLRDVGARSTVFLATDCIGGSFPTGRACLTAQDVRDLSRRGVEFGSHTASHPHLYQLPWDKVETELRKSKERVEDIVGMRCNLFAYPYRFPEEDRAFTQRLRVLLRDVGYEIGVTTAIGCARPTSEALYLPRLPINEFDDAGLLQAKLQGAYDWLRAVQLGVKRTRAAVYRSRRPEVV